MQTKPSNHGSVCFLFDNGSLRAESTLSLRKVAEGLAGHAGCPVQAVSLLHSSAVPADALGGLPARLLEPALVEFFAVNPEGEAWLVPLFFGPSAALTDYLPARITSIRSRFPAARLRVARWLVDPRETDVRIAEILADRIRSAMRARNWTKPKVILTDHGSPQPAVAVVRDHLAAQVKALLGAEIADLVAASMERREGDAYAFNEPLLATALRREPFCRGNTVVALQFLSPGRHAGAGGDIADICRQAEAESPGLITHMTETIAGDARLIEVLAQRLADARPV